MFLYTELAQLRKIVSANRVRGEESAHVMAMARNNQSANNKWKELSDDGNSDDDDDDGETLQSLRARNKTNQNKVHTSILLFLPFAVFLMM